MMISKGLKTMKSTNESAVRDIFRACRKGLLSWEEVAKKAVLALAEVWDDDLDELFDLQDTDDLEERIEQLERKLM